MTTDKREQTIDLDRFHQMLCQRRQVLEEGRKLAFNNGDGRRADSLTAKVEECDNIEQMLFLCREPKTYNWRIYGGGHRMATLSDNVSMDALIKTCDKLYPLWRDEALEWVCGCYDNPDEARDALWDILASDRPHETLMARVMDDVKGLRLHENESAMRNDEYLLFLQYQDVML